jgi:hypothetical protein
MSQSHESVENFLKNTLFSVSKQHGVTQFFLTGQKFQRCSSNSLYRIEPNISDKTIPELCTLFLKDNIHVRLDTRIPRGLSPSDFSTKSRMI